MVMCSPSVSMRMVAFIAEGICSQAQLKSTMSPIMKVSVNHIQHSGTDRYNIIQWIVHSISITISAQDLCLRLDIPLDASVEEHQIWI